MSLVERGAKDGRPVASGRKVTTPRAELPQRVYLAGFMGCGKTSLGRLLASRLGWRFTDLDAVVEQRAGLEIHRIFSVHGEPRFRRLEHEALQATAREEGKAIVSLGGGAFVSEANRDVIHRSGASVWIDVPFRTLLERISGDERRPLASTADQLYLLYRARLPFYHEADVRLRAGKATPEELARELIRILRNDWAVLAERRGLFP